MSDARSAALDLSTLPPSIDLRLDPRGFPVSPSCRVRLGLRQHRTLTSAAPVWQGLEDDAIEFVCSALGPYITELSVVGCTQLDGNLLLGRVNDKCPCLHTLNVS
jgi:hypothetical protein